VVGEEVVGGIVPTIVAAERFVGFFVGLNVGVRVGFLVGLRVGLQDGFLVG